MTVLDAPPPPTRPRRKKPTVAHPTRTARTFADVMALTGDVPPEWIVYDPELLRLPPAEAAERASEVYGGCEWISGILVAKATGFQQSIIASRLSGYLAVWSEHGRKGEISGEQGMITTAHGNVRMPDLAFYPNEVLPDGVPDEAAPRLPPVLVVEVLSPGNTAREIDLKLRELFASGCRLAWVFEQPGRTVRVHTSPEEFTRLTEADTLDGGDVLPGFAVALADLFRRPTAAATPSPKEV